MPYILCISTYTTTAMQNFPIFHFQLTSNTMFILLSLGNNLGIVSIRQQCYLATKVVEKCFS